MDQIDVPPQSKARRDSMISCAFLLPGCPMDALTPVLAKYLRVSSSWVAIMPEPPIILELKLLLSSHTSMQIRTPSLAFLTSNSPAVANVPGNLSKADKLL